MHIQTSTPDAPGAAVWPDREGFLAGLCAGRFHWDLIHPFPRQDAGDRSAGDAVLAELRRCAGTQYDADVVAAFERTVSRG